MPPLPQPLSRILAADPTLAAWDQRRRREQALTELIRRRLPRPLASRVRVADAEGPELGLAVDAGAIAAIVRQRTPDLLDALCTGGWQFTGIRVRVQVRSGAELPKKQIKNQPDRDALRPLAGLARELPAGPLKSALARLLRRIG
jgi:hypothetical protein